MSVNINTMNLSSICEGCLSTDRKLSVVFDSLTRELFISFHGELNFLNNPLSLCWECVAIIKKIIKYKQQVQKAHVHLISFMLHQSNSLPPLSNLATHINTQETQLYQYNKIDNSENSNTVEKNIIDTSIPFDEKDSNIHLSHTDNLVEESKRGKETQDVNNISEKEREPLFIKVENEGDNNFEQEMVFGEDFENFYADDSVNGLDDKDLKVILKSDPTQYGSDLNGKIKRRSKRKTVLEFNESDDEPLKKKKVTKSKERKKKEKKVSKSGRGREAASGVVESACAAKTLRQLGVAPGTLQEIRLSWQEVEEERQRALASEAYLRHAHRCEDCALGFNHRSKLDNHMKKHQPSAGELECTVCHVRCRTQHALTAHRSRHRVRWRCIACGELGSRAAVLADHAAREHGADSPTHRCSICGDIAPTLSKLRNHLKNHAERQKCELCGKTFRDKSTLKTHLFIHKGEKEYACPTCGKLFLFKKAMQLHSATHDAPALLYCHECDMNFKNQMTYYQHMKYNLKHVDPARLKYECSECGKRFMKAARLNEHMTAVHLKLTPVRCPETDCHFACASRAVLRGHTRAVHRQQRAARNHVCHACGKAYTNKKTLEGHLRAHSGERPFACTRCGATFGHHAALYNHTRLVHLAIRNPAAKNAARRQATTLNLQNN